MLDYDPQTQLLIAAALDQRPNAQHGRVAALYSMDQEGLPLRYKAAVAMPEQKGGQTARERQPLPLIALSLSPLGAQAAGAFLLGKHLAMAHAGKEMAIAVRLAAVCVGPPHRAPVRLPGALSARCFARWSSEHQRLRSSGCRKST